MKKNIEKNSQEIGTFIIAIFLIIIYGLAALTLVKLVLGIAA